VKVVPRKLCKYTLPKGLTAAPRGRKEAQEGPRRLSKGSPPESGPQVQRAQRLPEGAIAMGKATLGIATFAALANSGRIRTDRDGKGHSGYCDRENLYDVGLQTADNRDGKGHSGYCDFSTHSSQMAGREGSYRDGKGHSGYCDFSKMSSLKPVTPKHRDGKGHSGYCDSASMEAVHLSARDASALRLHPRPFPDPHARFDRRPPHPAPGPRARLRRDPRTPEPLWPARPPPRSVEDSLQESLRRPMSCHRPASPRPTWTSP
jgi:hypothetical protein